MLVCEVDMDSNDLLVDDMSNAVVQDVVGEGDACVVDPGRTVGQDSEGQVVALEGRNSDVAQRWGENDSAGNDVVAKDLLERIHIRRLKHGTDRFERLVGGHEDGEVGYVKALVVGSGQSECEVELSSLQSAVHAEISSAVGEELERGSERKHRVDFVDGDTLAQFDVLF